MGQLCFRCILVWFSLWALVACEPRPAQPHSTSNSDSSQSQTIKTRASGSWTVPEVVSRLQSPRTPSVFLGFEVWMEELRGDNTGNRYAIWEPLFEPVNSNAGSLVLHRPTLGADWIDTSIIRPADPDAALYQVVNDKVTGAVYAVWASMFSGVYVSQFSTQTGWSVPDPIDVDWRNANPPISGWTVIAETDRSGGLILFWMKMTDGGDQTISLQRYSQSNGWGRPSTKNRGLVATTPSYEFAPWVRDFGNDDVLIVIKESVSSVPSVFHLFSIEHNALLGFSPEKQIANFDTTFNFNFAPNPVTKSAELALVTNLQSIENYTYVNGSWRGPNTVLTDAAAASGSRFVLNNNGELAIVWTESVTGSAGQFLSQFASARFDAALGWRLSRSGTFGPYTHMGQYLNDFGELNILFAEPIATGTDIKLITIDKNDNWGGAQFINTIPLTVELSNNGSVISDESGLTTVAWVEREALVGSGSEYRFKVSDHQGALEVTPPPVTTPPSITPSQNWSTPLHVGSVLLNNAIGEATMGPEIDLSPNGTSFIHWRQLSPLSDPINGIIEWGENSVVMVDSTGTNFVDNSPLPPLQNAQSDGLSIVTTNFNNKAAAWRIDDQLYLDTTFVENLTWNATPLPLGSTQPFSSTLLASGPTGFGIAWESTSVTGNEINVRALAPPPPLSMGGGGGLLPTDTLNIDTGRLVANPVMHIDGSISAVWSEKTLTGDVIRVSNYQAGLGWQTSPLNTTIKPSFVTGSVGLIGDSIMIIGQDSKAAPVAQRFEPISGWTALIGLDFIGTANDQTSFIDIAGNGATDVQVVWESMQTNANGVQISKILGNRFSGTSGEYIWTGTEEISAVSDFPVNASPRVAMAESGATVVSWTASSPAGNALYVRHFDPVAGWQPGADVVVNHLPPENSFVLESDIAINANGKSVVSWKQLANGPDGLETRYWFSQSVP